MNPVLDADRCYAAVKSHDRRFDGVFYTAVRTTGIYCRPSCPAITPKRHNVEFYRSAAAAQQSGFRACKRCLPDATPGSPEWDIRGDLVGRAMDLIADGVVDRDGVAGLAHRLSYSERHLNRVLVAELGAGPVALARAQRAQTARTLIETTDLTMTEISFAAGFGSVRQFNDTIRSIYATAPTELRSRRRCVGGRTGGGVLNVHLATREPFNARRLFEFFAARAVPGVEWATSSSYSRSLALPHGHGVVDVVEAAGGLDAALRLADWRDLAPAVRRLRTLFDLDADSVAIDEALGADRSLSPLVEATPGLRSPGTVDVTETMVRAVIGQQVSVAGARTVTGRLAEAVAEPLAIQHEHLSLLFPAMDRLVDASDEALAMPASRRTTLRTVARAVLDGTIDIDADRATMTQQLLSVRGIGPWTAGYVRLRGRSDPDVLLDTDLGIKHAAERLGVDLSVDDRRWRPWRTYATQHLWTSLSRQPVGGPGGDDRP